MNTVQEVLEGLDDGQKLAIVQKVARARTGDESEAEEVIRAVLSGDLRIVLVDGTLKLVDHTGRGIPLPGMEGVVDANRAFHLVQPKFDFAAFVDRLARSYTKGTKFPSAIEVEDRFGRALALVRADGQVANLTNGVHVPFVIPQFTGDLGTALDEIIVPTLERSYRAQYPNRQFNNWRKGKLAGQVTVVAETRQNLTVEAVRKGPVVGAYFPCLQGFGIAAARQFVRSCPEFAVLAGMEVPAAVIGYPEVFGRGYQTPGLDMSSLVWQSEASSLCFEASDGYAVFRGRSLSADGSYASGVSVLG